MLVFIQVRRKMIKQLKKKWLSIKIESHWMVIRKFRNKGNTMINNGAPLSSPKLFSFDKHISKHGKRVMAAQKQYKKLYGIAY